MWAKLGMGPGHWQLTIHADMYSFLGGFHVHEKAILLVTVLLGMDAVSSAQSSADYIFISVVGHYALLPLLFTQPEYPIKVPQSVSYPPCSAIIVHVECTGSVCNAETAMPVQVLIWILTSLGSYLGLKYTFLQPAEGEDC